MSTSSTCGGMDGVDVAYCGCGDKIVGVVSSVVGGVSVVVAWIMFSLLMLVCSTGVSSDVWMMVPVAGDSNDDVVVVVDVFALWY